MNLEGRFPFFIHSSNFEELYVHINEEKRISMIGYAGKIREFNRSSMHCLRTVFPFSTLYQHQRRNEIAHAGEDH